MESRGSCFLALANSKEYEMEDNQEIYVTLNRNSASPTKKSAFDRRGTKANKARPAYGNEHVAEKRVFKENINVSNLQVYEVANKNTCNNKGYLMQKEGTTRLYFLGPTQHMQILHRHPDPIFPFEGNNEPNSCQHQNPARQIFMGIKSKPPKHKGMRMAPGSQDTTRDVEGVMEDDGGIVVAETPNLGRWNTGSLN